MKFLLRFILIAALAYLAQSFLPWWSAAVVAFAVGLLLSDSRKRRVFARKSPPARAFLAGFLALFLLWGGMAFFLDLQNDSLLSSKIAQLFSIEQGLLSSSHTLVLVSALIGGAVGGFSAMTGNLLGEAIKG